MPDETQLPLILDIRAVCQHTSMSRAWVYVLLKRNQFPRPVRLPGARRIGWRREDVLHWAANLRPHTPAEGGAK